MFANDDMKYEVHKLRAKLFAKIRGASVTYVPAKDSPSTEALRERPDLPLEKLQWLQRHDREMEAAMERVATVRTVKM